MLLVILQRFWQKTNLKMFVLSVYNEVKTKYLYNQVELHGFNENHPAFKTNRSSGVATTSVNPNTRSAGAATIGINPAPETHLKG